VDVLQELLEGLAFAGAPRYRQPTSTARAS
jgi:hypothetical protein